MASRTRSTSCARRRSRSSSTVGTEPTSNVRPTCRSIARRARVSRGSTRVIATPSRPARPTRPMRCTYCSGWVGSEWLITWVNRSTSRPRAATSVATTISTEPSRSSSSTRVRAFWSRPPWRKRTSRPRPDMTRATSSTSLRVRQKTSVAVGSSTSRTRVSAASLWLRLVTMTCSRICGVSPSNCSERSIVTRCGSTMRCSAMRTRRLGIVALNRAVWRSAGAASRIASRSSAKPMSSISSASSRTTYSISSSLSVPRLRWSTQRPGVATTTSTPLFSRLICRWMGWPP